MSLRKKRIEKIRYKNRLNKTGRHGVIISSPDNVLLIIIGILTAFGSMAVFSAGAPEGSYAYNNPAYYFIRHVFFVALGMGAMIYLSKFDYKRLKYIALPFAIVTIALICATYIPGLGKENYGSKRWLVGLPIQPSELAKLAVVMLIPLVVSEAKNIFNKKFWICIPLLLLMLILIFKQPNLSITIIIGMISLVILLAGGMSSTLLSIPAAGVLFFILPHLHGYQAKRITGWLNPWADPQGAGYNLIQSWYAIGSGGIFGVGFGNSKQKLFWLPFRHTDFIFSIIAEELGLIGCLILIGLFIAFIHRGFLISTRCSDQYGKLVALGITFAIGFQAFINIGVATGVLPVTGVTLPLISYGGTSLIITYAMLGVLLNISRKRIKKIEPQQEADE